MLNLKKSAVVLSWLAAALWMGGCGSQKRIEGAEAPTQPGTTEKAATVETAKPAAQMAHYIVRKDDCLWVIAGRPGIYGDSFQWPLIFKANRDVIQDPDLIYPKQEFKIGKDYSAEEVSHSKQLAMDTPRYVPHAKPREALPVNYF